MQEKEKTPFKCHVFVCTNDRQGSRKSCADGNSHEVRRLLKEGVTERALKPRVRISQSGCLGVCQQGPNVMIYPQGEWYSAVTPDDVTALLKRIEAIIEDSG